MNSNSLGPSNRYNSYSPLYEQSLVPLSNSGSEPPSIQQPYSGIGGLSLLPGKNSPAVRSLYYSVMGLFLGYCTDRSKSSNFESFNICPQSIISVVGMVFLAAGSEARSRIKAKLGLSELSDEIVIEAFGELSQLVNYRNGPNQVNSARLVGVLDRFEIKAEYSYKLQQNFNCSYVNKYSEPAYMRSDLNQRIEGLTGIKNLLPSESVENLEVVFAQAMRFKALWNKEFDPAKYGDFKFLNGSTTKAKFLSKSMEVEYSESRGHTLVKLPFQVSGMFLVLALPAQNSAESLKECVNELGTLNYSVKKESVIVKFPEIHVEILSELDDLLDKLVMNDMDFSSMIEGYKPRLLKMLASSILHIDHKGGEGSSAVATVVYKSVDFSMLKEPKRFTADRPFIFAIEYNQNHLFLGSVTDGKFLASDGSITAATPQMWASLPAQTIQNQVLRSPVPSSSTVQVPSQIAQPVQHLGSISQVELMMGYRMLSKAQLEVLKTRIQGKSFHKGMDLYPEFDLLFRLCKRWKPHMDYTLSSNHVLDTLIYRVKEWDVTIKRYYIGDEGSRLNIGFIYNGHSLCLSINGDYVLEEKDGGYILVPFFPYDSVMLVFHENNRVRIAFKYIGNKESWWIVRLNLTHDTLSNKWINQDSPWLDCRDYTVENFPQERL